MLVDCKVWFTWIDKIFEGLFLVFDKIQMYESAVDCCMAGVQHQMYRYLVISILSVKYISVICYLMKECSGKSRKYTLFWFLFVISKLEEHYYKKNFTNFWCVGKNVKYIHLCCSVLSPSTLLFRKELLAFSYHFFVSRQLLSKYTCFWLTSLVVQLYQQSL